MRITGPLLFVLCLCKVAVAQQSTPSPFGSPALQAGFLENMGQVRDFNNKPVEFVYFQANLGGQQVFITRYGLSLLFARPKKISKISGSPGNQIISQHTVPNDSLCIVNYEMERIDIVLKNASILAKNIAARSKPLSPEFNLYFDDFQSKGQGLHLKSEVMIKNVYPGIDWKVYIKEEPGEKATLKYDFIVHPGADPSLIQLRYSDNAKIELAGNEVQGWANMVQIKEKSPYSYLQENNKEVKVNYQVKKNTISFNIGDYDREQILVIDPSIFWLTYLTSQSQAWQYQSLFGNDVETDAQGNIFVQMSAAGNVPFPTISPGGGAYYQDYTASPNGSMIISKFAPGGQLLWSTYFGNWVGGRLMTIDKFGNIITVGMVLYSTPSFPNPNPSIPLLNNGGYFDGSTKKYFIAKFSNAGVLTWSSWYVNFSSYPMDMSYDINGNVYVVGWSEVHDFPVVNPGGGAYAVTNPQFGWAQTLFISQFNATNQLTWSTRIEGNDYDPYARVCTDKLGNIYIGGQARSSNYPLVNAGGYFNNSAWGSVISRFNPARQMTWSTYYPGAFSLADITTDDSSNLYVVLDRRMVKFNSNTQFVFEKSVNTTQMHFWRKMQYDPVLDQIQLLGTMNDGYWGFPTLNTSCNSSFFNNGISPHTFSNAMGPIFATIDHDGEFSYRSLVDWVYEYYEYNEMTIDIHGDPIYLFGNNSNGFVSSNPQLTNPGNGAYFNNACCMGSNGNNSALLLKLTASGISVNTQVSAPTDCNCTGVASAVPQCGQSPFNYLWSNGATTSSVSGLCPGNYWVKVTDANNVSKTVNVNIPDPPGSITSFISQIIPENCSRSNAVITIQSVQGGSFPYTYSIDGINYSASSQFAGLDSGSHIVHIRDANGCKIDDTVLVSRINGPLSISYNVSNSSCATDDGKLEITNVQGGIGPFQYSLNGAAATSMSVFTNLAAANYQLTISDTAGCQLSSNVVIGKSTPPTDVNFAIGDDHCNQGIGFLQFNSVTGGTSPYAFSIDSIDFNAGSITNLHAGNYFLFVKDSKGCVLKKGPLVLSEKTGPDAVGVTVTQAYCGKLSGDILINAVQGGTSPHMYSIDGGGYTPSGSFTNIAPGIHDLNVKDAYGCLYSRSFQIDYKPLAGINLSPADTTICYDEMVTLKIIGDVSQASHVSWNIPAQGFSAVIKASEEKNVYVTLTDSNNCIIKDTSIIKIKACNGPEQCIVIPTAFTPNRDGKNETIGPVMNGCRVASIQFKIYNRWGEVIFETYKPGSGWNGIFRGVTQPGGVYIFLCTYVGEDGVHREKKGTILLIR